MARPWIMLHAHMLHHPGIGRLSDRAYRAWITMLLMASQAEEPGVIGSVADVAWTLHLEPEAVETALSEMNGRIARDGDVLRVRDWDEWQAPKTDAQRQRECRARKKAAERDGAKDVSRDGHVTSRGREEENIQEHTRTETEGADKPPRPDQLMFESLCRWRRLDVGKLTPNMRGRLNKQGATLRAAGYDAADVDAAAKAWKRDHWKGQRGDPPSPADVEEWLARDKTKAPVTWTAVDLDDA